ncbi:MAG: hypothetical protein WCL19_06590 [Verrucomicrobiota bacterium]
MNRITTIHAPRISIKFIALLGLNVLAVDLHSQPEKKQIMHDSVTHEQLSAALRGSVQKDPMKSLKTEMGADPSVVNRPQDLISQSDVVCFGGYATLVPKGAILQIPKNFKDRIHIQPGVQIQSWSDFYAANRGWITAVEVSRVQAEGNKPISQDTHKQMVKSGNLIVATYQGGPISVLPLKHTEASNKTQP